MNEFTLEWVQVSPIDSPLLFGSTQLERYKLMYGFMPRNIELVFWHHDGEIQNFIVPLEDKEDSYTIELSVTRFDDYNLLISRTDTKDLASARACVDFYKKLCTRGLDDEFE
jgi:hypothetical protein